MAVTCTGLHVNLSADGNGYVFTAAAGGDTKTITGYTFNFGDHQSYAFTLAPADVQDRAAAAITHSYAKPGTYRARVSVHSTAADRSATATAAACQATITLPPSTTAAATLPATGATGAPLVFAAAVLAGTLVRLLQYKHRRDWRSLTAITGRKPGKA